MKKLLILSVLGLLPLTQMATVLVTLSVNPSKNKSQQTKAAPELPLQVLSYFMQ